MVFTSLEYLVLLTLTLLSFWSLPARHSSRVLLAASLLFYASWSVRWLGLVGLSIAVGYGVARWIDVGRSESRPPGPWPVVTACVVLLGTLGYFKYADFFIDLWNDLAGGQHQALRLVLPLAISFYTFQILAYVIDVHRGAPAERSLPRFVLFVTFFPQLIAGPIVRRSQLLPQLGPRGAFSGAKVVSGLEMIAYGVVKKMVFADNLAVFVDRVYGDPSAAGGLDVVAATLAFGAQIYCDFSGYTDMARGSARLFGIELPVNFRWPYQAKTLSEFWHRWHITLSTWLRDYLYIPLGGNRVSPPRVYANLLITMTLGGLWHGASITFVLWGLYHGLLLALERALGVGRGPESERRLSSRIASVAGTFLAVQVGWAIFRAESLEVLWALASSIAAAPLDMTLEMGTARYLPLALSVYFLQAISARLRSDTVLRAALLRPAFAGVALTAAICLVTVFGGSSDGFIYFQF